jgi:drug/metabolite transporter (DMT)-like permease
MRTARTVPAGLALVVAVCAVSWAAILIRWCEAPSLGIAFYRLLFSTLIVLPWGFAGRESWDRKTLGLAAAAGALLALHFATWISSLSYTTVASSVVLVSTQPVFTAILGPFLLGERPGARGITAMVLCLAGVTVLAGGDLGLGAGALLGDSLALAGAVTASLYFMIGRKVRHRIAFGRYLFLVYGSAALVLGMMALAGGVRLSGYPDLTWLCILGLAVGPNLLGHGLLNWSVRRLRAFTVNMAVLGEPVLATAYAAAIFAEYPGLPFYAGAALILGGIVLAVREDTLPA